MALPALPLPRILVDPPSREKLSVGVAAVDQLTGGGIPCATMTEICGSASSGRTSLLFSLLRQATERELCCAVVDTEDRFDPQSATAAGIHLERLLWVRCCGHVEHALKATDLLIRAGGFGLVVMDLGDRSYQITRRIPLTSWFRLRHGAGQSGAALIVTAQDVHAASCSQLQLELRQNEGFWSNKLLKGMITLASLRKRYQIRSASFRIER